MSSKFVVYYWDLPFRGNFVKLALVAAGVEYTDAPVSELVRMKKLPISEQNSPFMAPPAILDQENGVFVSQMAAAMYYIAAKFNLLPTDVAKQALAMKVILDCNDVLAEITRSNGAQMWDRESWELFRSPEGRFIRWISIFEETGKRFGMTATEGFILGTETATIADIAVLALYGTMLKCLPGLESDIERYGPRVFGLCGRLGSREEFSQFFTKQREALGDVYCGGMIEKSIRAMLAPEEK